ncbi:MAG: hypothetical protein V3U10_01265 [Bacteroidota bacterium]
MMTTEIGSVSHGTMRNDDLIPTFVEALDNLKESESLSDSPDKERYGRLDTMLSEIEQRMEREDYYASEDAGYDLEALFEALNEYAPPFCFFGAHEGDGTDYGFWPSNDAIEDAIHDGEIVKVDAGDEWPEDMSADYVIEVNDHGNMALYDAQARRELWSIV